MKIEKFREKCESYGEIYKGQCKAKVLINNRSLPNSSAQNKMTYAHFTIKFRHFNYKVNEFENNLSNVCFFLIWPNQN